MPGAATRAHAELSSLRLGLPRVFGGRQRAIIQRTAEPLPRYPSCSISRVS